MVYNIQPNQVVRGPYRNISSAPVTESEVKNFWANVFQLNPQLAVKLARNDSAWWRNILYSRSLTPQQKFQMIFGINLSGGLLGDIFEDIGNWFSGSNLQNAELYLREGQNQAGQWANALNYLRNQPDAETQAYNQMQQQNIQSSLYSGAQTYGTWLPWALGGLILILLVRK